MVWLCQNVIYKKIMKIRKPECDFRVNGFTIFFLFQIICRAYFDAMHTNFPWIRKAFTEMKIEKINIHNPVPFLICFEQSPAKV